MDRLGAKRKREGMSCGTALENNSHVGKMFRFTKNPSGAGSFNHMIFDGPPINGWRCNRKIPASEIYVDFSRPYEITAVYEDETWTAFQFEVEGQKVWTNARKWDEWWGSTWCRKP